MILVIDNYDSFVYNLARYFEELGREVKVVRNDVLSLEEIKVLAPDAIVISPGPCTPNEAGLSLDIIKTFAPTIPILGVCLGHQAIGQVFGGDTVRASQPMHGKTSDIEHDGSGLFTHLPSPLTVTRYHSLVIDPELTQNSPLRVQSQTANGDIMAVFHEEYPVYGVQFHPEAALTQGGHKLIENFLQITDHFWQKEAA
ncbi:anthranilate synthase component II [Curvivirga aplysinae]|uniref:anthranilate synthase component II n=1 Tax=Curvivirga aplysinae TaxID=2529852 RepID=UPI0012BD0806|nr:aminodeoxychorismate/anthranilate synthase component II [Curvivirga aplysinae]MTI11107.1 aminodeoxychorismate/anthranilate synthase component II [Curvivirga aplysinae]